MSKAGKPPAEDHDEVALVMGYLAAWRDKDGHPGFEQWLILQMPNYPVDDEKTMTFVDHTNGIKGVGKVKVNSIKWALEELGYWRFEEEESGELD